MARRTPQPSGSYTASDVADLVDPNSIELFAQDRLPRIRDEPSSTAGTRERFRNRHEPSGAHKRSPSAGAGSKGRFATLPSLPCDADR
jgi:hypothetical protein